MTAFVLLLASSSLLLAEDAAPPTSLEVFPLHYRTAEELLPLLRPMLSERAALSGQGKQILIRANANEMAELLNAIRALDQPPVSLRVSVRHRLQAPGTHSAEGVRQPPRRIYSNRHVDANRRIQQVQVAAGESAYLDLGESMQVPTLKQDRSGNQSAGIRHKRLVRGFHVRPQVHEGEVVMQVRYQYDEPDPQQQGAIRHQAFVTQLRGSLGEWITLGGVQEQRRSARGEVLYRNARRGRDLELVEFRVEQLSD